MFLVKCFHDDFFLSLVILTLTSLLAKRKQSQSCGYLQTNNQRGIFHWPKSAKKKVKSHQVRKYM